MPLPSLFALKLKFKYRYFKGFSQGKLSEMCYFTV